MSDATSLIKANYAATIMRVAKGSERTTAAQLIEGLATDAPDITDRANVTEAHKFAIEELWKLSQSIRGPAGMASQHWDAASDAVRAWRRLLD